MFKYEYVIEFDGQEYSFAKENNSETTLSRDMPNDILNFCKSKNIPAGSEIYLIITKLYDEEYYDSDEDYIIISDDYTTYSLAA